MSSHQDRLIVGLGNPGDKYTNTRHNFGWQAIDALAKKFQIDNWTKASDGKSLITGFNTDSGKIRLLKPMTFMNESGIAVASELNFYKITNDNLWVIHDELDLPLGTVRLSYDVSAAGHNGIKSIIEKIGGQKFWRLRLGIGQNLLMPAENYVLQNFFDNETDLVNKIITSLSEILLDKITVPEPKNETITFN